MSDGIGMGKTYEDGLRYAAALCRSKIQPYGFNVDMVTIVTNGRALEIAKELEGELEYAAL